MALEKLKKWIGTQLWSTFMTEYNENVDATNAVIDLAEANLHTRTIAGAQNFNNYTTAGTWYFKGSEHTSGPVTTAGFLRVTGTAGAFILQEYFDRTAMYTRRQNSAGQWNAWVAR